MKNTMLTTCALLLLLLTPSCKKGNDKDNSFFRFKVDGAAFEAEDLLAYAVDFTDDYTLYGVNSQNSSETCYINILATTKPGTYTLGAGDYTAYYIDAANKTFSTNWGASDGTVTIEEIDASHVKGTFQFTAYDSDTETVKKTITGGEFNVTFR